MCTSLLNRKFSGMFGCHCNLSYNDVSWENMLVYLLLPQVSADMLTKTPWVTHVDFVRASKVQGCECGRVLLGHPGRARILSPLLCTACGSKALGAQLLRCLLLLLGNTGVNLVSSWICETQPIENIYCCFKRESSFNNFDRELENGMNHYLIKFC